MATSPSDRAEDRAEDRAKGGGPSPEELAAIIAAVTVAWPAPAPPRPETRTDGRGPGWRFSGRWWAPDDVVRRRH